MASMCIKTKRIDVAEICLSQMGHARGAAALRESKVTYNNNINLSIAILAIHLGYYDDAIQLYKEAGRYDLITQLLQASGKYEKSIRITNTYDSIHIQTTHYEYASYLESISDINGAIEQYELSHTANIEVPRMLYNNNMIDKLEKYIHNNNDSVLWKWWGCYLESIGKHEKASKYYKKANDYLSCVRIACYKVNVSVLVCIYKIFTEVI